MVSLSDIPCIGKLVDRISDATVEAVFRRLRYLFCYKELVNVLDSEIEKLNIQEGRLSKKSVQEENDGKIIEKHVLGWQTEVDEFQESAKEFSEKYKNRASWTCLKCLPIPQPLSRFQLGREAVLKAKRATALVDSGKELLAHEIAHLPPIKNLPKADAAFQDFPSRKHVYGKLWEALITEGSSLILGIYGMPGVGKTRMVEQLWQEAMEKKIFNKVARADVGSEKLDVIKLQNQIAAHLNCHFKSHDNVESRASQLKTSLMKAGKILIILDDVWSEISLDDIIGTSFGEGSSSKGSKILLTSRREDVCLRNKCKRPVQIQTLRDQEAWDLFQNTVGTSHIASLQDEFLAKKVCTKCAGLPLLIRAVGKTLQFMSQYVWRDALQKLESGNFNNIAEINPQVYACVKLSIDRLPEDAKLCLFLCSLFPEDADIHINKLIQLAIGSQLIPDGESAVRAMVDILTISSLLLECDKNHITKLHDIIRDVARSIAFTDPKYAFLHVRCGSRLPDNAGYSIPKLLRLDMERDDARFPEDLVCTHLVTLWLQGNYHLQQFSGGFFGMFENLRFLMLQNVHILSEQFSLQPLRKLKMLIFDNCDIRETDKSLFPENLKTLCIWASNLPSPLDLPNLIRLQKLDIQQELPEVIMVPNAISSLSSLEILHIPNGFRFSNDAKDITPILDEISKLTCLTSLKIFFSNFEACQGTSIFFNLLKYDVSVGRQWKTQALPVSTRRITLIGVKVKRDEALQSLMERAEEVRLLSTDVDVSSIWNSNKEAFADLRDLEINSCNTVEYIVSISQDEIQHSHQPRTSFSKLTILKIERCSAMKYLFCKSVAKCLVQLQELYVINCDAMEAIVMNDGTSDGEIIDFSKLRSLELSKMGSLKSFYRGKKVMYWGSTDNSVAMPCAQFQPLFDGMVAFPSLEVLRIKYLEHPITDIWGKHYSDDIYNNTVFSLSFCKLKSLHVYSCDKLEVVIPDAMLHRLRNLESLDISHCGNLRNAFPPCIARDLIHLNQMEISLCGIMREIVGGGEQQEQEQGVIVFPQLIKLKLADLKNLTNFWCYPSGESSACKVEFPSLVNLRLSSCGKINLEAIEFGRDNFTCTLKTLFIYSDQRMQLPLKWQLHFLNLERLTLRHCWWHELKSLRFPKLRELDVKNCGQSTLFTISSFKSLEQLRRLTISECALLEEIVEDVSGDELAGVDTMTLTLFHLVSVTFKDLPSLKNFINCANFECYMPALEKVKVDNCGLSSLFTCSVIKHLQQLDELVVMNCRLLESIVGDGRGKIISFSKLKSLWLKNLRSLTSFYREMHWGSTSTDNFGVQFQALFDGMVVFPSLEDLRIEYLEHTNNIWGKHYSDAIYNNTVFSFSFCQLKSLHVYGCDKLEIVIPDAMLHRLGNLVSLKIEECSSLRNAFPPCIARELIHLNRMIIRTCGKMKEIITNDSDDGIIMFPELKELKLLCLKNLTSFWYYQSGESDTYKVEFRSLVKFHLYKCGDFNFEAIKLGRDDSSYQLKRLFICSDNYHMQLPCKWQLHLQNLERLTLDRCWWHELKDLSFPNLKKLEVVNCERSALFTISGFRSLQKLQRLKILKCTLLEEVVEDVCAHEHAEMDTKTIKLLQLDSVVFKDLPNLKSFIHGANYECYMPALEKLKIVNCGISSLFTCSVFKNLQQLHELAVLNCRLLEGIVVDGREDNTSGTNDKSIILSQLSSVTLRDLPNIRSFSCSESYAFSMPKLQNFHLLVCPQLENFSYLKTSTGLVSVYAEGREGEKVTDLNDFMIQNYKRESNLVKVQENQVSKRELEPESGILEEEQPQGG